MIPSLFPRYYLDDHHTGQVLSLDTKDYLLAGFFGALYVFWRTDFSTSARAFLGNLAFLAVAALGLLAASSLPGVHALIAAATFLLVLAMLRSRAMVRLVVSYHAINGWEVIKA